MRTEEFTPKPNMALGKYRHYKGNFYDVLELACHTETHEWYVVYKSLYDSKGNPETWVRPYTTFTETVNIKGTAVPRFQKVTD